MYKHEKHELRTFRYKIASWLRCAFEQVSVCGDKNCEVCKYNYEVMKEMYRNIGFTEKEIAESNSLIPRKLTQKFRDE